MPNFHETIGGRKFFEGDVPRIANALEKIAAVMTKEYEDTESKDLAEVLITENQTLKKKMLDVKVIVHDGMTTPAAKVEQLDTLLEDV